MRRDLDSRAGISGGMDKRFFRFLPAAAAVVLLAAAAETAGAYDFGLTTDNTFRGSYDDTSGMVPLFEHKDSLWLRSSLGEVMTLDAEGSFLLYMAEEDDRFTVDSQSFQVDQLSLDGVIPLGKAGGKPVSAPVNMGRFPIADFTGKVLVHTVDGASLGLSRGKLSVGSTVGYTGLLPVNATTFLMTDSDSDALAKDREVLPDRAPERLLETVQFTASEFFLRQTFTLMGIFHQDIRPSRKLAEDGGRANTRYIGAGLSGPLGGDFFWKGWGYLNSGKLSGDRVLAYMAGGGVDWYLAQFLSSKLAVQGLFASGDGDYTQFHEGNSSGAAKAFVPVTAGAPAQVFMPQYSNLFYIKGSWGMKPLAGSGSALGDHFFAEFSGGPFFRAVNDPISADGVDADYSGLYLGSETDLTIRMRLFSDLGLSLSGGIFYPGKGFSDRALQMKGKAALSFGI